MYFMYNPSTSSQIETILGNQNVTLQEVMDAENILSECKSQNKILMDYLIKPEVLQELVTLTMTEPEEDVDERNRFKYSNIACEMLTCDIPSLNERLAGSTELLERLYLFLEGEPPLNPLLASFFSKIMAMLIAKKPEQNWISHQFTCLQVLDFLKAKKNFVPLLLGHLGTSAIMDLALKLMTQVEVGQNNYLDSQRIIQSLVEMLDPKVDRDKHHNVAQLLCDFIPLARENQRSSERSYTDPLLDTLESPETIKLLLDHMLADEKSETAIVGGVQVLLELLDKTRFNYYSIPKDEDAIENDSKQKVIENVTKVVLTRLEDIHNLLLNPPKKEAITTTVGVLNPPLGNARLHVTKLLAALISCGGQELAQELIKLNTMTVLLDLFFAYPWNNFLHMQVQACLSAAFNSTPPSDQGDHIALSKHLLVNCKLVERILDAWNENDRKQSEAGGIRQGYMGHLIQITNALESLCLGEGPLCSMLAEYSSEVAEHLKTFAETTLSETNKEQAALLAGVHPNVGNDDNEEFAVPLYDSSSGIGKQNYAEFQMQQVGTNYFDSFGYDDDEFKDGDESLQNIVLRSGIQFHPESISENELVLQHEYFKKICAQNINTLDDADDQIFEKDHTFETVIEKEGNEHSSSDSDEDRNSPVMEVERWRWSSPNKASEAPSVPSDDPWGTQSTTSAAEPTTGWADFSSAVFDVDFEKASKKVPSKKEPSTVEADLKVENIEIDPKPDEQPVEKDSIDIAQANNPVKECDSSAGEPQVNEQNTSGDKSVPATEGETTGCLPPAGSGGETGKEAA